MKKLLALFMIVAVLFAQTGCALITQRRVAVAVAKKAYEKMSDDKDKDKDKNK